MAKKLGEPTRHLNLKIDTHKDSLTLLQTVKAQNRNHKEYLKSIDTKKVTICLGPAGTGKTWQAVGKAAGMLCNGMISRIVITRPLVVCGRQFGFLPGDKNDKVSPYMRPMLDAFDDFLGPKVVDKLVANETISLEPLELMRGSNIADAFIICDEAQNAEYTQLHMFLTRFAKGSKVVLTGDTTQTDLRHSGPNPLLQVIERFESGCHSDIGVVTLTHEDTMRDELTSWIDRRLLGLPDM